MYDYGGIDQCDITWRLKTIPAADFHHHADRWTVPEFLSALGARTPLPTLRTALREHFARGRTWDEVRPADTIGGPA
uniref:hypothetical protein n=1 Tax=Streptomyces chartreusis TaxID=1969 RepID=UPI003F492022